MMVIREIKAVIVSSDPGLAVKQINRFLSENPTYGLITYEIVPYARAVFGRYEELASSPNVNVEWPGLGRSG